MELSFNNMTFARHCGLDPQSHNQGIADQVRNDGEEKTGNLFRGNSYVCFAKAKIGGASK